MLNVKFENIIVVKEVKTNNEATNFTSKKAETDFLKKICTLKKNKRNSSRNEKVLLSDPPSLHMLFEFSREV
jgi:hypothetical protein